MSLLAPGVTIPAMASPDRVIPEVTETLRRLRIRATANRRNLEIARQTDPHAARRLSADAHQLDLLIAGIAAALSAYDN